MDHSKWEHKGTDDQSGVTNLFDDAETCNFRNVALTEYKIRKASEVRQLSNINIVARSKKCLEIGQNIGGVESFTRNPAQIMWHCYVTKEGYTNETLNTTKREWMMPRL